MWNIKYITYIPNPNRPFVLSPHTNISSYSVKHITWKSFASNEIIFGKLIF